VLYKDYLILNLYRFKQYLECAYVCIWLSNASFGCREFNKRYVIIDSIGFNTDLFALDMTMHFR